MRLQGKRGRGWEVTVGTTVPARGTWRTAALPTRGDATRWHEAWGGAQRHDHAGTVRSPQYALLVAALGLLLVARPVTAPL